MKLQNRRVVSGHAIHKLKLSEDPNNCDNDKSGIEAPPDADNIVSSMSALDLLPRSVRLHKSYVHSA